MTRGKLCPARATIFIFGEKVRARCEHLVEYHHDQATAARTFELVSLPHYVRFADGQRVMWTRDGEIIWVDPDVSPIDRPASDVVKTRR